MYPVTYLELYRRSLGVNNPSSIHFGIGTLTILLEFGEQCVAYFYNPHPIVSTRKIRVLMTNNNDEISQQKTFSFTITPEGILHREKLYPYTRIVIF